MARFTALTLLAFCLAMAAAQQQPPRLRGHGRTLQEATAAAAAAEPNKEAAGAPQGDKQISIFGERESDWPRTNGNRAQEPQQPAAKTAEAPQGDKQLFAPDRVSDWPMRGRDYKAEGEDDGEKQISIFGDRESDCNGNRAQEPQQQEKAKTAEGPAQPEGAKQVSIFEPTSSDWPKPGEPATRAKQEEGQQQEGTKAAEGAEGAKQLGIFDNTSSDWPKPGEPTRMKQQQQGEEGAKAAAAPEGKGDKMGIIDAIENPANGAKPGEPTS